VSFSARKPTQSKQWERKLAKPRPILYILADSNRYIPGGRYHTLTLIPLLSYFRRSSTNAPSPSARLRPHDDSDGQTIHCCYRYSFVSRTWAGLAVNNHHEIEKGWGRVDRHHQGAGERPSNSRACWDIVERLRIVHHDRYNG
jgi:hypothetical protein